MQTVGSHYVVEVFDQHRIVHDHLVHLDRIREEQPDKPVVPVEKQDEYGQGSIGTDAPNSIRSDDGELIHTHTHTELSHSSTFSNLFNLFSINFFVVFSVVLSNVFPSTFSCVFSSMFSSIFFSVFSGTFSSTFSSILYHFNGLLQIVANQKPNHTERERKGEPQVQRRPDVRSETAKDVVEDLVFLRSQRMNDDDSVQGGHIRTLISRIWFEVRMFHFKVVPWRYI